MGKHLRSIKKSENEKSGTSDTSAQKEKFPFPMTCRPPSEFIITNNEFCKENNKITPLHKRLRGLNTELIAIKSFLIGQFYSWEME